MQASPGAFEETAPRLLEGVGGNRRYSVSPKNISPQQDQSLLEKEELDMSSAQNSLGQPTERPESPFLREGTTLGRMTEPIAKELNECLCGIVINASTCLRMLSANPPNVEGARETARRAIRASNRAAKAVSRLSALLSETNKVIKTVAPPIKESSPGNREDTE